MSDRCPHCDNGYFDGSETECVNGVLIDIDVAHEGWQRDVMYPPAPCCACPVCFGSGLTPVNIEADSDDCPACKGTGWPDGKDESQERLEAWAAIDAEPDPATTIAALRADLAAKDAEIAGLRLEWKPISTYQQPTYAGYTPKVVVGRMWRGPDGRSEMPWPLGVAWFDEGCGKWIDVADKKPWPEEPTLWLCEVTGQPVAALKEPPHAQ